jgi:acyl carrier protein
MVVAIPTETRDLLWSPVLDGVRAAELDCLQTNLSVLADRHHGVGSHLALGAPLRFQSDVEATLEQRLTEARELLGLAVTRSWAGVAGPALRDLAAEHGPLYVVADTHTMSWLPYFGQRHMEHSFLLTGVGASCTVVDGYHNDTPWGAARPGVWRLSPAEFDAAVPRASAFVISAGPVPALDRDVVLLDNANALADKKSEMEQYVAAVRHHPDPAAALDQLVLDVWLLGRSRLLHATWVGAAEASTQAEAWLTMASQTFVALRRVQRGGGVPAGLLDQLLRLLHNDVVLASTLASTAIRTVLADTVAAVLKLDRAEVDAVTTLRDLPTFNSFRLVDVIEQVEARLGLELDPDDLATSGIRDLDALTGLFVRAASRKVER